MRIARPFLIFLLSLILFGASSNLLMDPSDQPYTDSLAITVIILALAGIFLKQEGALLGLPVLSIFQFGVSISEQHNTASLFGQLLGAGVFMSIVFAVYVDTRRRRLAPQKAPVVSNK